MGHNPVVADCTIEDEDSEISGHVWFARNRRDNTDADKKRWKSMTKAERIADKKNRPVMFETNWTGLDTDLSYSLNLYDKDASDCTGKLLREDFVTGIKNNEKKEVEWSVKALSVALAANRYVQLRESETGNQVACCMASWLYNKNLGKTRKEIRGERSQRIKNRKRGNKKKAKDWTKAARDGFVPEAEVELAKDEAAEVKCGGDALCQNSVIKEKSNDRKGPKHKKKKKGNRKNRNKAAQEHNQKSFSGF